MNDFDSIIKRMTVTRLEPGDYTGEDGLLYCGKCRTPKQFRMDAPPLEGRLLPHPCRCEQERLDREAAEQEASETRVPEILTADQVLTQSENLILAHI